MSEIEKMYENAGVSKQEYRHKNLVYKKEVKYPPFTPEKQIEILKLLCQRRFIEFGTTPDSEYFLYDHDCCQSYSIYFEEAVSEFVRILWQDLTEEEKQQVKGILE